MRILLVLAVIFGLTGAATAQALQPGDTIQISVFQDSKLDRQLVIPPSGMISFPLAGHLRAGGVTPVALENAIKARLRDKYTADLDVTVSLLGSKTEKMEDDLKPKIFVIGEVNRPGPYVVRTKTTVLQAIALAGGLGRFAADQRIQVRRRVNGVESIHVFNYREFESGRDMNGNVDLRPGDVVVVPERGFLE